MEPDSLSTLNTAGQTALIKLINNINKLSDSYENDIINNSRKFIYNYFIFNPYNTTPKTILPFINDLLNNLIKSMNKESLNITYKTTVKYQDSNTIIIDVNALLCAICSNILIDDSIIELLIENTDIDYFNKVIDGDDNTCLIYAVSKKYSKHIINKIIDKMKIRNDKHFISIQNKFGNNIIHNMIIAGIQYYDQDYIIKLLKKYPDLMYYNNKSLDYNSLLNILLIINKENTQNIQNLVQYLINNLPIENNIKDNNYIIKLFTDLLSVIMMCRYQNLIDNLVDRIIQSNNQNIFNIQYKYIYENTTALICAIIRNDPVISEKLINNMNNEGLNLKESKSKTALMHAIEHNNIEIVQQLITKMDTIGLNLQDSKSKTALMYAIHAENTVIAQQLIDKMDNIGLNLKDLHSKTALIYAIELNNTVIIELLINKMDKKGLNYTNSYLKKNNILTNEIKTLLQSKLNSNTIGCSGPLCSLQGGTKKVYIRGSRKLK
jgi:hypothetical protein